MGYKLNKALKKSKTSLIIALVLWVIITIVLVSPISYAVARSMINNKFDLNQFLTEIGPAITNISTLLNSLIVTSITIHSKLYLNILILSTMTLLMTNTNKRL